jgi:hypothetical protein
VGRVPARARIACKEVRERMLKCSRGRRDDPRSLFIVISRGDRDEVIRDRDSCRGVSTMLIMPRIRHLRVLEMSRICYVEGDAGMRSDGGGPKEPWVVFITERDAW